LKPERWGSLLVQETYQEEKACDKRHTRNNNNNNVNGRAERNEKDKIIPEHMLYTDAQAKESVAKHALLILKYQTMQKLYKNISASDELHFSFLSVEVQHRFGTG
jgi:hypothetical protein